MWIVLMEGLQNRYMTIGLIDLKRNKVVVHPIGSDFEKLSVYLIALPPTYGTDFF